MSCVVTFPVSKAIVKSYVSVIDTIVWKKVAFIDSVSSDTVDATEKIMLYLLNWSNLQEGQSQIENYIKGN